MANRLFLIDSISMTGGCTGQTTTLPGFPKGLFTLGSGTDYNFASTGTCSYAGAGTSVLRQLWVKQNTTCEVAALKAARCVYGLQMTGGEGPGSCCSST